MGDPSVLREDVGVQQGDEATGAATDLAALRALLVGPEQRDIQAIQARLNDRQERAEDLAEVLPQVLLRHTQDPQFTRALTPPIEKAITTSVQRNPKPLADALFPVMGPAIRMAVSAGLAGMVESLNRTLEHSLSWRSLQWRLEGWRTGKSFAEVVLAKTLVYRVEQVFLIDRRTGLLLQHAHATDLEVQDADMVSGMLTAIKDFVQDSFKVSAGDSLEALKVGDLSVWIEAGPHAIVAAVIRGVAPREFRRTLQDAIETIHLQFGEALQTFSGNTSAFADARSALETCLETRYRAGERTPPRRGARLLVAAVVIALLVWAGFAYRTHRQWTRYLELVRAEPGLVVVSEGRDGGRYVVSGLRDPLARDPQSLLAAADLPPARVVGHWAPYQALDPPLVLMRATGLLRPPAGVMLTLDNGVLAATGGPSLAWVTDAVRLAPFVSGVTRFDAARTLAPAIRTVLTAIEGRGVLFVKGSAELPGDQHDALATLVADMRQLDALAAATGTRLGAEIVGHADADGPEEANLPLSLERARTVADALAAESLAQIDVTTRGVGSADPAETGQDEASNRKNRRVSVHVTARGARPEDGR
jgi:outer membrane protein OmpA-like peptidoglycan-associated protein